MKIINKIENVRDTIELRKTLSRIGSRRTNKIKKGQELNAPLKPESSLKMLKVLMNLKNKSNKNFMSYINHQKFNEMI